MNTNLFENDSPVFTPHLASTVISDIQTEDGKQEKFPDVTPPVRQRRMKSVPSHIDKPPMNQHFPLSIESTKWLYRLSTKTGERDRKSERVSCSVCVIKEIKV